MQTVNVDLGSRSYPIHIGSALIDQASLYAPYLNKSRLVIVTNDVVAPLYLERLQAAFEPTKVEAIILPDGEAHKDLAAVSKIYD